MIAFNRGDGMDIKRRMYLLSIIEKMDNNKKYADKLGTKNKSTFVEYKKEGK